MRPLQNCDAWREKFFRLNPRRRDGRAERLGCRETDAAKRPKGDSLGRENHQSLALIRLRTGFGATSCRVNDGVSLKNDRRTVAQILAIGGVLLPHETAAGIAAVARLAEAQKFTATPHIRILKRSHITMNKGWNYAWN